MNRLANLFLNFLLNKIRPDSVSEIAALGHNLNDLKEIQGKILTSQILDKGVLKNIRQAEFKIYSQFGDDGIIQYLIQQVKIKPEEENFIEIGVENYKEANTRFLLINNNWRGLLIEGSLEYVNTIKNDQIYWRHDLKVISQFVTKENINKTIQNNISTTNLGLLSIDIDGNDYWVWEELKVIKPVIVIIEYNSIFGNRLQVAVPYHKKFDRTKAHFSNLYWGASLSAYVKLGESKGYDFLGTNSTGNNAYFIRKDRLGNLKKATPREGYAESKYRESRDQNGNLTYLSGQERINSIRNLKVYDLRSKRIHKISDLISTRKK